MIEKKRNTVLYLGVGWEVPLIYWNMVDIAASKQVFPSSYVKSFAKNSSVIKNSYIQRFMRIYR